MLHGHSLASIAVKQLQKHRKLASSVGKFQLHRRSITQQSLDRYIEPTINVRFLIETHQDNVKKNEHNDESFIKKKIHAKMDQPPPPPKKFRGLYGLICGSS